MVLRILRLDVGPETGWHGHDTGLEGSVPDWLDTSVDVLKGS